MKILRIISLFLLIPALCAAGIKGYDGVNIKSVKSFDHVSVNIIRLNQEITIKWNQAEGADFYRIYASKTFQGFELVPGNLIAEVPSKQLFCKLDNANQYEGYYFAVTATNKNGESALSNPAQYKTRVKRVFGAVTGADLPAACKDTYVDAGSTDVNYSGSSSDFNTYTYPINTSANRLVILWDVSNIPQDAIIKKAVLSLYMYEAQGTDYEITAHRIINNQPDINTCTWNTYDGTNSWTGGNNGGEQDIAPADNSAIVNITTGYKNFDITDMLRRWVANPSTNLGMILDSDVTAASDDHRYFRPTEYSNPDMRPKLTVEYLYNLNLK